MMMPGHTHEDIDAMFRFIADSLRSKGLVSTISAFEEAAREAFLDQNVHVEQVSTVHDFTTWFKPNTGVFEQIKSARYFVIALRESDGVPVMWYKPHVAHPHLYPTEKDPVTNMPKFELVDGEEKYITDMNGIEIFGHILPAGQPVVEEFKSERLDIDATHQLVTDMIAVQPALFDVACVNWWRSWRDETPRTATEALEKFPMSFEWPQKTWAWNPTTILNLQAEYSETITYVNSRGKQAFSLKQSQQASLEQNQKSPELTKGDLIVVRPGEPLGEHDRLPFWMAEVDDDKVPAEQSEINIVWCAAFKHGCAKDDVCGQWQRICKGYANARGGCKRYHPFTPKCQIRGQDRLNHGVIHGVVQRDEIVLYFAKLTKASNLMCANDLGCLIDQLTRICTMIDLLLLWCLCRSHATKKELWKLRTLLPSHGGVPKTWRYVDKPSAKKKRARESAMDAA